MPRITSFSLASIIGLVAPSSARAEVLINGVTVAARGGIYPGCIFSDSGLGRERAPGIRWACDALISVSVGMPQIPLKLELGRRLLSASPSEWLRGATLISFQSKITSLELTSASTFSFMPHMQLVYGFGAFTGTHSSKIEQGTEKTPTATTERDYGAMFSLGFEGIARPPVTFRIGSSLFISRKATFPDRTFPRLITVPTPTVEITKAL